MGSGRRRSALPGRRRGSGKRSPASHRRGSGWRSSASPEGRRETAAHVRCGCVLPGHPVPRRSHQRLCAPGRAHGVPEHLLPLPAGSRRLHYMSVFYRSNHRPGDCRPGSSHHCLRKTRILPPWKGMGSMDKGSLSFGAFSIAAACDKKVGRNGGRAHSLQLLYESVSKS